MTRFIMDIGEAVDLVMFAFEHGQSGDIMVQKAPACNVQTIARALFEIFEVDTGTVNIGVRHGEAMYETLLTKEEAAAAIDMGNFYRIPVEEGNYEKYYETLEDESVIHVNEFTSNNTMQLNVRQVKDKLLSLEYIQKELQK